MYGQENSSGEAEAASLLADRILDNGGEAEQEKKPEFTIMDLIGMDNIAEFLEDDRLREIGESVVRSYEFDKQSRAHREDKIEKAMNLALQITQEKNFPWPKASNVILPIITTAALEFAARAYPAIIDGNKVAKGEVVGDDSGVYEVITGINGPIPAKDNPAMPATKELVPPGAKQARADRVADHISYQLMEEEDNWEEDTDRLLHMLPIVGCVFRKRYWDPVEDRPCSELVFPQRLIVNYGTRSIDSAPTASEEIELFPYEITERIRSGRFLEFEYENSGQSKSEPVSDRERTEESATSEAAEEDKPHLFIQQLCRIDMDDDGYPEPYIVTVHKDTQKVCRMVANYREDGLVKNEEGQISRIKPETYYIKYGFIPSFDGGFYDLGFGELLLMLNLSINTLTNQLLDAGTLANAGGGFIGSGLRTKSGYISVTPGKYQVVETRGARLADSVYQLQHKEPSLVLYQMLGLLVEMAKDISGNKDVLAGEQQPNIAGMTVMAQIEQGLTKFKAIYKRLHRSIKRELKVQYRLNVLNLSEKAYSDYAGGNARKDMDYLAEAPGIVPVSDPTAITSMQRLAKAQVLEGYKDDPYVNPMEVRKRIFSAMAIEKPETLLMEPAPKPDVAAEALMATARAEMMKAQSMLMRVRLESVKAEQKRMLDIFDATLSTEDMKAKIAESHARTFKLLAEAEAAEAGVQLDVYDRKREQITPK